MRPHGRFAHCSCKNAALAVDLGLRRGFVLQFHTRRAPTARFRLLYRNILLRSSKTFYTKGPLFCAPGKLFCALVRKEAIFAVRERCANEGFACMCKENNIFFGCYNIDGELNLRGTISLESFMRTFSGSLKTAPINCQFFFWLLKWFH